MEHKDRIEPAVVRIAPSPTGNLHVGTARTALFNYLFAKKTGGKILLRIEDTDTVRSKKEYEENILDGLAWLGIKPDEIYRQSDRTEIYHRVLEKMLNEKTAYISKEEKDGSQSEVIRFKNPGGEICFHDTVRGDITTDVSDLGDFVIAKDLDRPLYHLAVVVDDYEMGITHIIRGDDMIANTPRQILLQRAIGAHTPLYTHVPLILSSDKSKLSKRHGAVALTDYRARGYLPEAVINFLALLGWHPVGEKEIYSFSELVEEFTLERIQKSGAIFDQEKLGWFNKEHIKRLSDERKISLIEDYLPQSIKIHPEYSREKLLKAVPIIIERITVFSDLETLSNAREIEYFFSAPLYDKILLLQPKNGKTLYTEDEVKKSLDESIKILSQLHAFRAEDVKTAVWEYATENGRGKVLWPMRVALSGQIKSPDPFTLAELLGKSETIGRLHSARDKLTKN